MPNGMSRPEAEGRTAQASETRAFPAVNHPPPRVRGTPRCRENPRRKHRSIACRQGERSPPQRPFDLFDPRVMEVVKDPCIHSRPVVDRHGCSPTFAFRFRRLVILPGRYWSASRNEQERRQFDPFDLALVKDGRYGLGHCHVRNDVRMFAIQRVLSLSPTGETFDRPADFLVAELEALRCSA